MSSTEHINQICKDNKEFRNKIFARGFLVTDCDFNLSGYPFYGLWSEYTVHNCHVYVHPQQHCFIKGNRILIGHAYNPFESEYDELKILDTLNFETLNQLTGIFTVICLDDKTVRIYGDSTCMQCTFYGVINGHYYISSHANLIGDLLGLEWDPYVERLVKYRFFKFFGTQLPGDLSEYRELKRLVPNHYVDISDGVISVKRFYFPHSLLVKEDDIVDNVASILRDSLKIIADKWKKPSISLTGGCDSKTTLSCANGLYDRFGYFSYISSNEEKVDANAAHDICGGLGLEHRIYEIPPNDSDFKNIEIVRTILKHNCGDMRPNNSNDVRKRAWFAENELFDVEVKSWVSEIGRAYYSKRFAGRTNFGEKPTPRKCSTLYKVFLNYRKLLYETDRVFESYLNDYFKQAEENPLPWQEQFFWEFRVAAWNGLVITHEHRYSFDITIPYNNRILLEYLLSAPINYRINDLIHKKIRLKMDPNVDSANISVQNVNHTKNRARIENMYYAINAHLPF